MAVILVAAAATYLAAESFVASKQVTGGMVGASRARVLLVSSMRDDKPALLEADNVTRDGFTKWVVVKGVAGVEATGGASSFSFPLPLSLDPGI